MTTINNFGSTTIQGNLFNKNYTDNSQPAYAKFDGNVFVVGNLDISNNLTINSNNVATQNYVTSAISALVGNAIASLDTLAEIGNSLANNDSLSASLISMINGKTSLSEVSTIYLLQADATTNYQTFSNMSLYTTSVDLYATYLKSIDASNTYLKIVNAADLMSESSIASIYLSQVDASNTYTKTIDLSNSYLKIAAMSAYTSTIDLSNSYLKITTASSTYQTIALMSNYITTVDLSNAYLKLVDASSTYLKIITAASTYQPISPMSNYLSKSTFYSIVEYAPSVAFTINLDWSKRFVIFTMDNASGNVILPQLDNDHGGYDLYIRFSQSSSGTGYNLYIKPYGSNNIFNTNSAVESGEFAINKNSGPQTAHLIASTSAWYRT